MRTKVQKRQSINKLSHMHLCTSTNPWRYLNINKGTSTHCSSLEVVAELEDKMDDTVVVDAPDMAVAEADPRYQCSTSEIIK